MSAPSSQLPIVRLSLARALALGCLLTFSAAPVVANPCANGGAPLPAAQAPGGDEGGIGGTGIRAQAEAGGIGGTGVVAPDEGGLGGTGVQADERAAVEDEGGITGTGIDLASGRTGILGTITGFASICVGGTEIHYGIATPVWVDGKLATAAELAVGQVVEVVADGTGASLQAAEIHAEPIVAGPVTGVATDHLYVAGQRIELSPTTWRDAALPPAVEAIALGTSLQVFGLRRADGSIDASRLTQDTSGVVRLHGPVAATTAATTRIDLAGTTVELPAAMTIAPQTQLAVRGRWNDDVLVAEVVQPQGPPVFLDRVGQVEVEAYARAIDGQLDIAGLRVAVDGPESAASLAGQRVKLTAELDAGRRVKVRSLVLARPRPVAPLRLDRPDAVTRSETTTVGSAPAAMGVAAEGHRPPPQAQGIARPPHRGGRSAPAGLVRPPVARPPHLPRPPVPQRPPTRPKRPPGPR